DEHVDPAERLHDAADHLVDGGDVADVAGDGQAAPAGGAHGGGRLLRGGLVDVHDGDIGAGPGERERGGVADALAGAGDDGDAALECHSGFPPAAFQRLSLSCSRGSRCVPSTMKRSCVPLPASSSSSRTSTRKPSLRRSISVSSTVIVTVMPTSVPARWATSTRVPTVACPCAR